jgi:nucleotide-binding universal stress UspA family protein
MSTWGEKDRYGEKVALLEQAREHQGAAERDRELLRKLCRHKDEHTLEAQKQRGKFKTFTRILCLYDFEESSLRSLGLAAHLAAQNDAELYILYVCRRRARFNFPGWRSVITELESEESVRRRLRQATAPHLADIRYQLIGVTGQTAETVIGRRSEYGVDLIVIRKLERHGAGDAFLARLMQKIVEQADCPVLMV